LFLGLLALLGVAGAWIGWHGYQQKALIDEIRDLGGYVGVEPVGPDWFRQVIGSHRIKMFDRVVIVTAGNCPFTDDTVRRIRRWTT
jgi:hypothetical protein